MHHNLIRREGQARPRALRLTWHKDAQVIGEVAEEEGKPGRGHGVASAADQEEIEPLLMPQGLQMLVEHGDRVCSHPGRKPVRAGGSHVRDHPAVAELLNSFDFARPRPLCQRERQELSRLRGSRRQLLWLRHRRNLRRALRGFVGHGGRDFSDLLTAVAGAIPVSQHPQTAMVGLGSDEFQTCHSESLYCDYG